MAKAPWESSIVVGSFVDQSVTLDPISGTAGVGNLSRGWEAAETSRLNAGHWSNVSSSDDINADLQMDLKTIQQRARHEAINNGIVEGALETHATDVVGDDVPGLQMLTDDNSFNEEVEQLWEEWIESCEHQQGLALADLMHGWVGQWWFHGEFLVQELIGRRAKDYRLHDLGAELIDINHLAENIVLGVELDKRKQVVAYWIADPTRPDKRERLSADYAVHAFRRRFSGQLRGIPVLGSSLQPTADLRDYDDQVMDAARAAADQALWMISDHPDAEFAKVNPGTVVETRRRQWRHAMPGWKPFQMQANQPMVNYVDFRKERQREVGRPAQMPLLVLRQDASGHNYSSARFDANGYWRAVSRFQRFLERRTINKFLRRLIRLAVLDGSIRPGPDRQVFSWTWPKPPAIDAVKERLAERIGMENGTLSYSSACAANGQRADRMIKQRQRDNADLVKAGLPPVQGAMPLSADEYAKFMQILNDEGFGDPNNANSNS